MNENNDISKQKNIDYFSNETYNTEQFLLNANINSSLDQKAHTLMFLKIMPTFSNLISIIVGS